MAITAEMRTSVLELYTAYFNRVADKDGVDYWLNEMDTNGWTVDQVAQSFADQAEYTAIYGSMTNAEVVATVYTNVLGRTADAEGAQYWEDDLAAGNITVKDLVNAVVQAAKENGGDDAAIVANKAAVSQYAYDLGRNETNIALTAVTADEATKTAVIDSIDAIVEEENAEEEAAGVVGATVAMTTAIDSLAGTANNDTFVGANDGANDTMNLGDTIAGGRGTDTLSMNVSDNGGAGSNADAAIMTLNSVETIKIKNTDVHTDIDATEWTGVETLHFYKSDTTAVSSLQNNVTVEMTEGTNGKIMDIDFALGKVGTDATLSVILNNTERDATVDGDDMGLKVNTVNATSDIFTTLDITSNGTSNDLELDMDAAGGTDVDSITTLNVSGAGALNLTVAHDELETLTAVNAGTMTGALTLDLATAGAQDDGTSDVAMTITTGSGDDTITTTGNGDTVNAGAGDDTVVGGAGNDTINGGEGDDTITTDAGTDTVDAGAGDDTVIVAGNLTAADSIDGGEGYDIISMTQAAFGTNDASTTAAANIRAAMTNFEAIMLSDSLNTGAVEDISKYGVNHLILSAADILTGAEEVKGFTSGATVEVRKADALAENDVLTVTMTGATGAGTNSDELNILFNSDLEAGDGDTDSAAFAIDGINIVNVTTQDLTQSGETAATRPDQTDGYTLALSTDSNLNTLNITGEYALTYAVTATATALATVDASSATGDVSLDMGLFAGNQGLVITTGDGDDTVIGSDTLADIISLGAGDDTYNAGDTANAVGADQVDLGTGADTVIVDAAGVSVENAMVSVTNFNAVLAADEADTLEFLVADTEITADVLAAAAVDVSGADEEGTAIANTIVATVKDGIISISGSEASKIDTLAEWLDVADVATVVEDSHVAAFEFDGNTYVLETTAAGAVDNVVELVGVTGVTAVSATEADNTIHIA